MNEADTPSSEVTGLSTSGRSYINHWQQVVPLRVSH
jgi:hypothetical protein